MKSKSLKTPLRYPGGKSRACTKIESYFPDLSKYKEYREPFLGGGSVALYVTQKFPHLKIWVSDLYEPLVNFWQVLQWEGNTLSTALINLKNKYPDQESARSLFIDAKELVNDQEYATIDRAIAFYVVNKCSFSGLTESSSFSKQASDANFTIRGLEKLPEYSKLISNWIITKNRYEILLKQENDVFLYMDPPYEIKHNLYGKKGTLHKCFNHDYFASDCSSSEMNILISYNSDQLIKDRFESSQWNVSEFDLTYTMRSVGSYMRDQKDRKELMLFNYDI